MRVIVLSACAATAILCGNPSRSAAIQMPSTVLAETVTTTVRGLGKTSAEASSDARRQAEDISGSSGYVNLGQRQRKVGETWICDLKISYRKK